jgi:uncharacterized protein
MARDLGVELATLIGNKELIERIDISHYIAQDVGEPTLRDILDELRKPGRDPRSSFEPPQFRDDVMTLEDLKPAMMLEGVVTNVTAFGVFVDIGVHHDGLVHISQLADRFVKDPHEVVHVGEKLKVKVIDVDLQRQRISLSCRLQEGAVTAPGEKKQKDGDERQPSPGQGRNPTPGRGKEKSQGPTREGNQRRAEPRREKEPAKFTNNPFAKFLKNTKLT